MPRTDLSIKPMCHGPRGDIVLSSSKGQAIEANDSTKISFEGLGKGADANPVEISPAEPSGMLI